MTTTMHHDSKRNVFPTYNPEIINQIAIVIADESVYEEKTDTYVSTTLKDHTDVNNFIKKLGGFLKENGFEIETFGTREQMAAKLYKKDGKDLMTEEEVIDFINREFKLKSLVMGETMIADRLKLFRQNYSSNNK